MTSYLLAYSPLVAVKGVQILYAISGDQKSLSDRGLSKAIFRAQKQCDPIGA